MIRRLIVLCVPYLKPCCKVTDYFEFLMPLYKTISVSSGVDVYLWRVSETESELRRGLRLSEYSEKRLAAMRSGAHRKGYLSIRQLLLHAGFTDDQLVYNEFGKPSLLSGVQISISHSFEFSAIIVSKRQRIGIDIELQRPKILRIASRFTPPTEARNEAALPEQIQQLTKIWCAKEALYKAMSVPGLRFLDQIHVAHFHVEQPTVRAWVDLNTQEHHFLVHFLEFSGYSLAYAIQKE